jgi:hypothetical protein
MAPEECDCTDVCGWTMPHTVPEGKTHCSNCGTSSLGGEEFMIDFECQVHGEVTWRKQ